MKGVQIFDKGLGGKIKKSLRVKSKFKNSGYAALKPCYKRLIFLMSRGEIEDTKKKMAEILKLQNPLKSLILMINTLNS